MPRLKKQPSLLRLMALCCAAGLGALPLLQPQRAMGAEAVSVIYGPLEFSMSVDALQTFADTGEVTGGLRLYARFLDDRALADLRLFLQRRFEVDPFVLSQLTYAPLGEEVLQRLGGVVRTNAGLNGALALRSAMILAADEPDGLSIIGVLRRYPSHSIRISAQQLLTLKRAFVTQIEYRDAAVEAIAQAARAESASQPLTDVSPFPNLDEPGAYAVTQRTLALNRDRQTLVGEAIERRFRVLLYLPEGLSEPAPVVVISHGLGSTPEAFAYLGEHLASHGFAAVLPQHIGSDESRRQAALSGMFSNIATPVEFIDRPYDITHTLNELERLSETDPALAAAMNLEQVGVIGHSLGGYTALALAGANLNTQAYLREQCDAIQSRLDTSFVLQCSARLLPPYLYQLRDERVQAAIAVSPLTSLVFGPEGMGDIQIPTMIVSGSNDFIASAVQEQIHPFLWLTTPDKYLALIIPSSHAFVDNTPSIGTPTASTISRLLSGPSPALGQEYISELSLAFMQVHLNHQPDYEAFLTSAYAESISQPPLDLELVRSLTPEQLEQAFGGAPPIPVFPQVAAAGSEQGGDVLEEIAATGVLRAAVQADSAPFGAVDASGQLRGYCVSLLDAFANQLQQQLDTPVRLEITARSTRENRLAVVREGAAQIECGPNTISEDVAGVAFSAPFFLTGTQFLVPSDRQQQINPLGGLSGIRVGVLDNTPTERFVRQRYPDAQVFTLPASGSQADGIQALSDGVVDTFASDGILLLGAVNQQHPTSIDYTLLPRGPLTCAPYGFVLPDDPQWQETVNRFLLSTTVRAIRNQTFTQAVSAYLFLTLDNCVQ